MKQRVIDIYFTEPAKPDTTAGAKVISAALIIGIIFAIIMLGGCILLVI